MRPRSADIHIIRFFTGALKGAGDRSHVYTGMFRNDFINSCSHEFKTPIVSINGFTSPMLKQDVTGEGQRYQGLHSFECSPCLFTGTRPD